MSGKSPHAGMQANIANFVRQEINVPQSRPLLPVFEAISNSLDAIDERGGVGTIRITVERDADLIDGARGLPHTFIVEDDGIGFNDDNIDGFNELNSDRKAQKGGKRPWPIYLSQGFPTDGYRLGFQCRWRGQVEKVCVRLCLSRNQRASGGDHRADWHACNSLRDEGGVCNARPPR